MDTTFNSWSGSQLRLFTNDVSSLTWGKQELRSFKRYLNNKMYSINKGFKKGILILFLFNNKCHFYTTHLHFLILINQEKTGNLHQKFFSLRFDLIGYLDSSRDSCLDRVDLCRFGWWRIGCELVFLLAAYTVGAFLTVLAQVNFAVLAADH